LGVLMSANLILVYARAIDCPLQIRFADVFIGEVAIFARRSLFDALSTNEMARKPSSMNEADEDHLTTWIAHLFRSLTGQETSTDSNQDSSSEASLLTSADATSRGLRTTPQTVTGERAGVEDAISWVLEATESVHVDAPPVPSPKLLVSSLRPYQQLALNWMVARERAPRKTPGTGDAQSTWLEERLPDGTRYYLHRVSGRVSLRLPRTSVAVAGGILADEMGLGKTVEAIALILANPRPNATEPFVREPLSTPSASTAMQSSKASTTSTSDAEFAQQLGVRSAALSPDRHPMDARHSGWQGGTLIVCPMSILGQWCAELNTHVADDDLFTVHAYYANDRETDPFVLARYQVVVTTYGTLYSTWKYAQQTELVEKRGLYAIFWHRLILDEAHIIKNPSSGCSRAVLDLGARYRWALTGTPLQNKLEDIFPLLRFLDVDPWADSTVWKRYIGRPFESGQVAKMQAAVSLLSSILQPLMLRRTKRTRDEQTGEPILQLPSKHLEIVYIDLSPAERELYDAVYEQSRARVSTILAESQITFHLTTVFEMLMRIRQLCDHPFLIMSAPSRDLATLHDVDKFIQRLSEHQQGNQPASYLRQLADTFRQAPTASSSSASAPNGKPLCPICLESIDDAVALRACAHLFCRDCMLTLLLSNRRDTAQCPVCRKPCSFADLVSTPRHSRFSIDIERGFFPSAKLEKLLEHLAQAVQAHEQEPERYGKCVVFSQWTGMLDMIEVALQRWNSEHARPRFRPGRLDGTLSQRRRAAVLEAFATTMIGTTAVASDGTGGDMNVLLASLRAGGVGLNLTAASAVFLVDPWWNPYVEDQAVDRIHRMGQTRPVQVRRYIVRNSVEERMLLLQEKKRSMVEDALGSSGTENQSSRLADMMMLFSIGHTASRIGHHDR
jgi:DNA repair protein RAD5